MIGLGEINYRISIWESGLMVAVAVIYDLVQITLTWLLGWIGIGFIGSWLMTLWAGMTFGLWFTLKGASIMSGKRAASFGIGAIIEAIPLLNTLPGWTVSVIISLSVTRAEDILASSALPIAPLVKKLVKK
ncbi:MAG: hypothetical protein HY481_00150 [Candidatus Vogelbacteria bacterium]|nr:hypothetical protein [Candidatus Vogelbacteria bacterium]